MRRQLILLLLILMGTVAIANGQEGIQPSATDPDGELLVVGPTQMIAGLYVPIELEPIDAPPIFLNPEDHPGDDTCTNATLYDIPDGGQMVTNDMTEDPADPVLACMWGAPSRIQGYRTVWYKFTAPTSGWVTIDTAGSTYDTILAVYGGDCESLIQVACNDDQNGFHARVEFPVLANQLYFVEAADWHSAANGDAVLNIAAWLTVRNDWKIAGSMAEARSRHAVAIVRENIYVIGGQTSVSGNPVRTPRTDRYNTITEEWQQLADMPAADDGLGYSNTTAAHVNAKIYVPSGYTGNNNSYEGIHWVYDIATNSWSAAAANNWWPDNKPVGWSSAVSYVSPDTTGYFLVGGLHGEPPTSGLVGGDWTPRAEMWLYVPELDIWFPRSSMDTARFAHTAALQQIGGDDFICVVGGVGQNNLDQAILLSDGECYDITGSESWSITTGPLNYPRYNAGSGVGPDGTWYVFGGTNALGKSVAVTEYYDRANNSWVALESRYDLGTTDPNQPNRPPRAWPRGGFVDHTLWAVGGHRNPENLVINLVEKLFLPDRDTYLPVTFNQQNYNEPDDTLDNARYLPLNRTQQHLFYAPDDYYDMFYIELDGPHAMAIYLRHLSGSSDYDIYLYNSNKRLLDLSNNVGSNDELIFKIFGPGTFYIVVERIFPPPGSDPNPVPYEIEAEVLE